MSVGAIAAGARGTAQTPVCHVPSAVVTTPHEDTRRAYMSCSPRPLAITRDCGQWRYDCLKLPAFHFASCAGDCWSSQRARVMKSTHATSGVVQALLSVRISAWL